MTSVVIAIIDSPLHSSLPGFRAALSVGAFPIWGGYRFIDFALASLGQLDAQPLLVAAPGNVRDTLQSTLRRWEPLRPRTVNTDHGSGDLQRALRGSRAQLAVIASASSVALYRGADLLDQFRRGRGKLARVSVESTALDLFVGERERLVELLGARDDQVSVAALFAELAAATHTAVDVAGRVLFFDSVRQLYRENRWLIDNLDDASCQELGRALAPVRGNERESTITDSAYVKRSIIGAGAHVAGYVEGSFIFPGCTVGPQSQVIDSVVMSNNHIGAQAEVVNALIFPHDDDPVAQLSGRGRSTIGAKAQVGRRTSNVVNIDYPQQIRGFTLIGMNPDIPPGTRIESGCYVEADVSAGQLRENPKLPSGTSVRAQGAQPQ